MSFKRSVLITGCSEGGIGDALAREFHCKGFRVFASARNPAKIAHLKPLGLEFVIMDVTNWESIDSAVKQVAVATGGHLDILVNNSGAGSMMPLMDADINEAKKLFDVNVVAVLAVTQAFLPLLMAAKGIVANNTSVVASLPMPLQGTYNASKAAVGMLTNTLRIELAPFDVKVVELVTGAVRTKFFDNVPEINLPEKSIYMPNKKFFEKKMTGDDVNVKLNIDTFARCVIGDLMKSSVRAPIWRGGESTLTYFIIRFLPYSFLD